MKVFLEKIDENAFSSILLRASDLSILRSEFIVWLIREYRTVMKSKIQIINFQYQFYD